MLSRTVLLAGLTVAVLGFDARPALASSPDDDVWGGMDCTQHPHPGCELGAGTSGSDGSGGQGSVPGPRPGQSGGGQGGNGGSGGSVDPSRGDESLGPGTPLKNCRYVRSDYQPPEGATQTVSYNVTGWEARSQSGGVVPAAYVPVASGAQPAATAVLAQDPSGEEPGAWYVYRCSGDAGVQDGLYRPPVFIPDGQTPPGGSGGPPPPSPEELARQAYSQLRLPSPSIAASPEGPQLVRLPTWMWIESGWEPVSATASVPGVSVTATAKPTTVDWSMGEGGSRTCDGPGTHYTADEDPRSASPDCGYTYRRTSGEKGFSVTATVRWSVTWSGAGQSGTFDGLSTTSSTSFVVEEVGAVNGR